jgi:tRNA (guanine-N7-)-methyltransferase
MRRRIRQHVNPLSINRLATGVGRVTAPPGLELEVELGCADADFLFGRAAHDPGRFYVGVDIRREMVRFVREKAAASGLAHCLTAVYANLLTELDVLFDRGSVSTCHINFPDPYFKPSQHKRRFLTPELVRSLGRIIRPGGTLAFQTDVFELALEALELIETQERDFVNVAGFFSFSRSHPFGATSRRERKCEARGIRIWRLRYLRR